MQLLSLSSQVLPPLFFPVQNKHDLQTGPNSVYVCMCVCVCGSYTQECYDGGDL